MSKKHKNKSKKQFKLSAENIASALWKGFVIFFLVAFIATSGITGLILFFADKNTSTTQTVDLDNETLQKIIEQYNQTTPGLTTSPTVTPQ